MVSVAVPAFLFPGHGSPAFLLLANVSMASSRRLMPFLASAMACSHPFRILSPLLNFSIDLLSRLLNTLDMTHSSNEYRRAYEAAQRELSDLLRIQEALEKRIVLVRQTVQGLREL